MVRKVMILSSVHRYDDSRIFHKQAVSLARAGFRVELHAVADFDERMENGVRIVGLPSHRSRLRRLWAGWRLFRRALRSKADVYHFHDPELLPWGLLLQWITRRPVVYDVHEDLPKQVYTKPWIPPRLRGAVSRVVHFVEKGMARRLSAVITATESIGEQFSRVQKRVVIKNYPLPMPEVDGTEREGSNRILYVGGISYLRGYREMIAMMDHIPPELGAELHLIGPLQYIDEEDRDPERLKEKGIHLHGVVPFREIPEWLAKGKVGLVCLHPVDNYREALPIKMFEYMAAGLPVVATDFPLWRRILEESGCGVTVDPLNPADMAEKVTALLKDDPMRQRMGKNGRRAFLEKYNWRAEETKLLDLYRELTEERGNSMERKPFKIWIANHYAVPPNIEGITRHFELAREWVTKEHAEVTLWLSRFLHPRRSFITEDEMRQIERVPGLDLNWLWSFPHRRNDIWRIINMISFSALFFLAGLFRKKPDVLVASSPHLLTALAGWLLARLKGCSFVLEVRDLWPDSLLHMGRLNNSVVIRLLRWLESFLYNHSDRIVVLTEYQRKFITAKGIDPDRITLIPNGVMVGSWKPDPAKRKEIRRQWGITEEQFVAIYTGAHGPANALEVVVKAGVHLESGISIVLMGDGPEKEKLIRLKEELGLDHVHLMPPVPKQEVYDYIYAADCSIISLADNEIFRGARSNKLYDYMFVGLPIVTTVDGELREIIEENGVGLFAGAENPEGLARAIARIRQMAPEERARIAQRGMDYIQREGNRKVLAHRYFRLLKQLWDRERFVDSSIPERR